MSLKLFFHPLSPYSRKVLCALYEKGIEFEPQNTNLFDAAVRANYKSRVNPLCKIPFLEHGDHVVPESSIIIEYLDGKFPTDPQLIPASVDGSRKVRFYDRLGDLYLIERASTLFFQGMKPPEAQDADLIARCREGAAVAFGLFNKELIGKDFLVDDRFTMADIAPGVGARALSQQGFDLGEYPNVAAWVGRISARPSFGRISEQIGEAVAALQAAAAAGPVSEE